MAYNSIHLPSIAPSGAVDDIGDIVIGKFFHSQTVIVHPDQMLRVQRNAKRNSQPTKPKSGAISHRRAGFAEEPRGDPSSLKLRRDKVYLLDSPSRRNAMKPEADDRRFDKRLPARRRRTQFAKITPQQTKKIPGIVLLSHSQIYSTIAAGALNYRVREGNVCFCSAIDTGNILQ